MRDLALSYAGRYATTQAKLKHYLKRKLRTRGWAGEDEPAVDDAAGDVKLCGILRCSQRAETYFKPT